MLFRWQTYNESKEIPFGSDVNVNMGCIKIRCYPSSEIVCNSWDKDTPHQMQGFQVFHKSVSLCVSKLSVGDVMTSGGKILVSRYIINVCPHSARPWAFAEVVKVKSNQSKCLLACSCSAFPGPVSVPGVWLLSSRLCWQHPALHYPTLTRRLGERMTLTLTLTRIWWPWCAQSRGRARTRGSPRTGRRGGSPGWPPSLCPPARVSPVTLNVSGLRLRCLCLRLRPSDNCDNRAVVTGYQCTVHCSLYRGRPCHSLYTLQVPTDWGVAPVSVWNKMQY